jgi:hypothetical protein
MEMEDWLESLSKNDQDRLDDWDEPAQPDKTSGGK